MQDQKIDVRPSPKILTEMAAHPSNNVKSCAMSEDDVITQVQQITPEDSSLVHIQIPEQPASQVTEASTPIGTTRASEAVTSSDAGSDSPPGGLGSKPPDDSQISGTSTKMVLASASYNYSTELLVLQGNQPTDSVAHEAASPPCVAVAGENSRTADTSDPPSGAELTADVIGSPRTDDAIGSPRTSETVTEKVDNQQSMQARLQEAIDKVEQLDRSLEKKFKENMEARAVTADLQALIRRELADLTSCCGGRQATREETDNTLQFLGVLADNDSESDTSGRVTPIFQTQVRFDRGRRPGAAAEHDTESQPAAEDTADPAEGGPPPPPPPPPHPHQAHDQYFIKRNIELAQEAGGSLATTEEEGRRLEQLLAEDDDLQENAFSIDQEGRHLLNSLDDRLSSLGAACSALPGSSATVSQLAGSGDGGAVGGAAADAGSDSERDYLQVTRQDRETTARLETLERRLEQLAAPMAVPRLDRSDVDNMIQDTIASLASVPRASELSCNTSKTSCGAAEPGPVAAESAPDMADSEISCSEESGTSEVSAPGADGGASPRSASEAPTEATLDVRSVLSGPRQDENERQLAEELRPGSPTAWLVDVSQGQQRFQLVVPRLSHQLITTLLDSCSLLPAERRTADGVTGQHPVSAGAD